ncbi:MAG: hypothetical protein LQ338_005217 [Usnochroma carphineum]|nr:MAG: hypothetical protein LQ338_005217 [Usnochroma carphineum]
MTFRPSTEIQSFFSADEAFFSYFDESSVQSCRKALADLETYMQTDGPFDAVLAFSQGAALASTLMVKKWREDPAAQRLDPVFPCAVFLSGGVPCDPDALLARGQIRTLDFPLDGVVIPVPTACIWGKDDLPFPPRLGALCDATKRTIVVHEGGHEVPGSKDKDAVTATVHAIRRTVAKAKARRVVQRTG